MGRHSRPTDHAKAKRNSVIALAGLVPAGVVATTATGASVTIPFLTTAKATPLTEDPTDTAAETVADTDTLTPEPAAATPALAVLPVAAPEPAPVAEPLPEGPLGMPAINYDAYRAAERTLAERTPGCGISWMQVAGIGRVESSHANGGQADEKGNLLEPIIGLPLDGSLPGQAVIMDTDGGALDGDPVYDRAVGPTQFIPSTWARYGIDGNGDGVADPQNLYDAAASTANYLCDGGTDMRDLTSSTKAILRYNNSMAYVANVTAWSMAYSTGISPSSADLPRIH